MTLAGHIDVLHIDYNAVRNDESTGSLIKNASAQTRMFPPSVGDIVIARDPDVDRDRWARVTRRHKDWVELQLLDWLPSVRTNVDV